jgi:CDP-glucose 4,6-dehydratase
MTSTSTPALQLRLPEIYSGKRVWLSGHTGFKGAWLAEWLLDLGAEVHGFALPPATEPSLFEQLGLADRLHHEIGDIRDADAVRRSIAAARPDFVFHLAAQPLVRLSYDIPVETFATNVMGTVHVLDALRPAAGSATPLRGVEGASSELKEGKVPDACSSTSAPNFNSPPRPVAAVMVTTDKCYENKEWLNSYREDDAMGGYDPYSASKGAAEIAIHAMRRSYFGLPESPVRVASARAGNVIGGGDWALDRIVPDCVRSLEKGQAIPVRNKTATRPWQHVLEPLSGYLHLAAALARTSDFPVLEQILKQPGAATAAFNFGPNLSSNRTVADLVQALLRYWPGEWEDKSDPSAPHEATKLNLATDKAFHTLGWQPRWDFATTIAKTVSWYREAESLRAPDDFQNLTRRQIHEYIQP